MKLLFTISQLVIAAASAKEWSENGRRLSVGGVAEHMQAVYAFEKTYEEASKIIGGSVAVEKTEGFPRHLKGSSSSSSKSSKGSKGSKKGEAYEERNYGERSACEAELAKCKADSTEQRDLFVQMADDCSITKNDDGTYVLSSSDIDDDTYSFSDRPLRVADTMPTSEFFDDFVDMFDDEDGNLDPPNAAVTLHTDDTNQFEGPLIGVFLDAARTEADGSHSYVIQQSAEQEAILSLESFFNSTSENTVTFTDCSLFIDTVKARCKTAQSKLKTCCNNDNNSGICPGRMSECENKCGKTSHCQTTFDQYCSKGQCGSPCRSNSDCRKGGFVECGRCDLTAGTRDYRRCVS